MIFRWWMPLVIGVGISATANGILIGMSLRVRPEKIVDKPYAASAFEDDRAAERASFHARGWSLETVVDGSGCDLTLRIAGGPTPLAGIVSLYRPDDRTADRELPWADPAKTLRCALPRPGVWQVRVALREASGLTLVHEIRINRP